MSETRPLAPEIIAQVFDLLHDETVPVQPFSVQYEDFFITADNLRTLDRTNAATYQLRRGPAEGGQWAGRYPTVRVLLRRKGNKLEQSFQYPHGWRDVVYDLSSAYQTDTEVLIGIRMVSGSAGRNRWFGRRDGKVETRTVADMEALAARLRQELGQLFAAQNPATDLGLPAQWLTVARLPLATPITLTATSETKTRLLRQLSQALVVGEVLRRASFGGEAPAPAYYLLGAVHQNENQQPIDQVSRFLAEGTWENDDHAQHADRLAQVRPGDRVALKSSFAKGSLSILRVKATGTVQATTAAGHALQVTWDAPFPAFDLPGLGGYRQTVHPLTKPADIAAIFRPAPPVLLMPTHPLNQILYGPPGTGKTYSTTAWALTLLNTDSRQSVADIQAHYGGNEEAMRQAYEQYQQQGQIGFVSFHQSFGYEDFVEGIKPVLAEAEDADDAAAGLGYRVEAGIFKAMAERATYALHVQRQMRLASGSELWASRKVPFDELYDSFVDLLIGELVSGNSDDVNFRTKRGSSIVLKSIIPNGDLRFSHQEGDDTSVFLVTKNRLEKLYATEDALTLTNTEIREAIGKINSSLYWAVLRKLKDHEEKNYGDYKLNTVKILGSSQSDQLRRALTRPELAASIARDFDFTQLTPEDYAQAPRFVLIIDEINRGNVASIFGELISLLEDDKRGGQPHELRLTLPYSKASFVVPPNLYVLGTMNTADRSVEALDTALRRRFSFHELAPQPQLLRADVAGIDLPRLLAALNERLEALLDRDHRLGHAWLLPVRDLAGLRTAFSQKIIPQLQEYFYVHWGRIGQVLGPDFVRRQPPMASLFAGFADDEAGDDPRPRYAITPAEEWSVEAFQRLYA
jgi:5-methylcytosine-specific restriction protein B